MIDRTLNRPDFRRTDCGACGWAVSPGLTPYPEAAAAMEARAEAIARGEASELVWLLEHPPLYTAGVSARDSDLLDAGRFPVFRSPRGGQYTYHGPGQRVAYVLLDLTARQKDIRAYVRALEAWILDALARFAVDGVVREGRVGVWIERRSPGVPVREDKIAAIGVKVRRWVSFHGISLNVEPDLSHFSGIVPCGQTAHGVTSLADLGLTCSLEDADAALLSAFTGVFGPVTSAEPPV